MLPIARLLALVAAVTFGLPATAAEDYPVRPIRLIVPFAPGGGTTIMARLVSDQLSARLGQPIVVENREGAGGTTGTATAARAKPDGYTLLLAHSGTVAIAPHLYAKIAYDPLKDFVPIGAIAEVPFALVVPGKSAAGSVAALLDLARQSPGKLTYASGGVGTGGHLAADLFTALTKTEIRHIPYRGAGPTLPDLLAGRVDLSVGPIAAFIPHIQSGGLRALAISTAQRSPLLPDVPTMKEAGVPGYEIAVYYGIVAPAGTPQPAVDRLGRELKTIVDMPETRSVVAKEGGVPKPTLSADYRAIMDDDYRRWSAAVKAANVRLD